MALKTYSVSIVEQRPLNLSYARRETVSILFLVYANKAKTVLHDLTGCSVYAEVRTKDGDTVLVDLLPVFGDEESGEILIQTNIPADLTPKGEKWDLLLHLADDTKVYLAKGKFTIEPSITDGEGSFVPGPTGKSVQEIIDRAYDRGHAMLPLGSTVITETVELQNKIGLTVQGHGSTEGVAIGAEIEGSHSTIYRTSNGFTDAMFKVRGANATFRDLCVIGNNHAGSLTGKNSAAFWISKESDSGTGSGNHLFDNVSVRNCQAAFQFGSDREEGNCDTTDLRKIQLTGCDKGIYQRNAQSIGIRTDGLRWTNFQNEEASVVYSEAGGDVKVTDMDLLSKCRILTIDQIYDGSEISVGPNNGTFVFEGLGKADNAAIGSTLVYLTGIGSYYTLVKVTFRNFHIAGDGEIWDGILALLGGGMEVTIEDCTINPNVEGTVRWDTVGHTGTTRFIVKDNIIGVNAPLNLLDLAESAGNLTYEFKRNYLPSGTRIHDWRGKGAA